MIKRAELHCHDEYSNIRLLDSTNTIDKLIKRALDLGLNGISLTNHDCLSGSIKWYKKSQELKKDKKDLKLILGNEIYLCGDRSKNQKYYHYILQAKDGEGFKLLRMLSSRAWMNSYVDRGMERVVTTYDDLKEIYNKNKGHLIASTACLGGEVATKILELDKARQIRDEQGASAAKERIISFINWNKDLFGDDFYLELQPALSSEQIKVNKVMIKLAEQFNLKIIVTTDSHYLTKEEAPIHTAFLNSKGGERETESFYKYAYLQDENDIKTNLGELASYYEEFCNNTMEICNKITDDYELLHPQQIPMVPIQEYPKKEVDDLKDYPLINSMFTDDDKYNRYWINQCYDKLKEKNLFKPEYLKELEYEADIQKYVGEKLNTNIFAYPITLQHYINMFWDCGSSVGAGRGSSCAGLNHYLLGVTQLDPIKYNLPYFRFLNKERTEMPDVDLDLAPSKRPTIMKHIKEERGQRFIDGLDELSIKELGITYVATFGTATSKSAIATGCRGYRSSEFPDGIDVDISQYLAGMVPVERGESWTINEMINGNEEKDRKPNTLFINEISKYPGLLDIIKGIEGLITRRGIHASGVVMNDEDPYKIGCYMKAANGDIITQYDLHDIEAAGATKYDFLLTENQEIICKTLEFLQKDNLIDNGLTIRQLYDKYLHPDVLDINDKEIWSNIQNGKILKLFQFSTSIGRQGIEQVRPKNINELNAVNALIRLMGEKGQERPMDKYVRFKDTPELWEAEMNRYNLTDIEKKKFHFYLDESCGIGLSQEQLMKTLMDEDICQFTLGEANKARKIIAKKAFRDVDKLKEQVFTKAKNQNVAKYEWDNVINPQAGYSFSTIHSLAYSFISYQDAYLATKFPSIYWNTACLCVNSGSLDEAESGTTDYAKIAKAINEIKLEGINVALPNINTSEFGFIPDQKNNRILYGLNCITRVNADVINDIKRGRPYINIKDFINRCPLSKLPMINLIKSGAFDELDKTMNRFEIMAYYIMNACEPKKKLTMQNFNGLAENNCLPEDLSFQKRVFNYNKYLKAFCQQDDKYVFDDRATKFFEDNFPDDLDKLSINGHTVIDCSSWKSIYDREMDRAKVWIKNNQEAALKELNNKLFIEMWNKYNPINNFANWEMESVCYYNSEHELANVDKEYYGIDDFEDIIPEDVAYNMKRGDCVIPIYNLNKIVGTVLAKNDNSHIVTILTPLGSVINIKFNKDYYAIYKSQIKDNGHIAEKGWFTRGSHIMVQGFKRDENNFVAKNYKKTDAHQLYKITKINKDGTIEMTHDRYSSATAEQDDNEFGE